MNLHDNQLVKLADEAQRPTRWWLAWIVAIVIVVGAGVVGQVLGTAVLGSPTPTDVRYQYVECFSFGVTLLALFLWLRLKEGRRFSSVGFRGAGAVGKFALGWVLGSAWVSVGILATTLVGQLSAHGSSHTVSGADAVLLVLPLVILFFLQGSTEEAVTRGYMLQMGGRRLRGWIAILAPAVLFAVAHVTFEPIVLINLVLFALFASFVALEQGSLWLIAGFHAGWNLFQTNIFGMPDSGNPQTVSIFSFGPAEGTSALINGGDFGIEGGLAGTLLFGIAAAVAYLRFNAARKSAHTSVAEETTPERR